MFKNTIITEQCIIIINVIKRIIIIIIYDIISINIILFNITFIIDISVWDAVEIEF